MKLKSPIMVGVITAALFTGVGAAPLPAPIDPLAVVSKASPSTVADAAPVATTETGTNAISATIGKTQVTIPTNPSTGVKLGSSAASITVGLPFSGHASHAVKRRNGVVSYDNNNGSTTVPVVTNDGSVQINTVIQNASAPTSYAYLIGVPAAAKLTAESDGSVLATTAAGALLAAIAAPWAKDANGRAVPTHYEMNGNVLTQIVDHNTPGTVYPVTADPHVSFLWWGEAIKLTKSETNSLASHYSAAYFSTLFCGYAGAFAVPCGAAAFIRLWTWERPIQDASRQGRCAQLNIPYGSGIALWNVTNERC